MHECKFDEGCMNPVYNPFDKPKCKDNHAHIKALILVQADVVSSVLTDREKLIVNLCICKNLCKKVVANMLDVNPSTITRILGKALLKLRKILSFCDKAITYYERGIAE